MSDRVVCITQSRKLSQVGHVEYLKHNRTDLDSHADNTCCAGHNCRLVSLSGRHVNVAAFMNDIEVKKNVQIGTVETAYDCPTTGVVYLLTIHEALYFGDSMHCTLLCPNQLRMHGIEVQDVPKQFMPSSLHAIIARTDPPTILPLELSGVISYITTRLPTLEESDDPHVVRLELTSSEPWDPYDDMFQVKEQEAIRNASSMNIVSDASNRNRMIASAHAVQHTEEMLDYSHAQAPEEFSQQHLAQRLIAAINVAPDDISGYSCEGYMDKDVYSPDLPVHTIKALSTAERASVITKEILASRWGCGLDTAKRTLLVTTQAGIRKTIYPCERRMKTKRNHLRFPSLNTRFYTDTMFSKLASVQGNKCAQIFTDGKHNTFFYPLKGKGLAHEALWNFVHGVGIPKNLTSDNALEEGKDKNGRCGEIFRELSIKQTFSEPYSPWQNRAEAGVRETKKGIRRATATSGSPKRLWDFCGEWWTNVTRHTSYCSGLTFT